MGDLLGSLTKPHTVGCAVAKLGTISVGKGPEERSGSIRPDQGTQCGDVTGGVSNPRMGDLLGSLTKPHTVGRAVAKLGTISVGKGLGEPSGGH
ncbi:hypothetical protein FNV43_RR13007 [Rhamnella rubrinervis]|uniref:Uncharacterized protein n=1 Tax=Rhamnella rubrinervis TaxID=2594499 RepID=A0A8K0H0C9_9ROSA|nr:hypothetical protein FNV43_RR13007 [Rhamnella rubrinervis]